MKELQLKKLGNVFSLIDIKGEDVWISKHIGYDGKLYVMIQNRVPEPIKSGIGIFPNPHANSEYVVAVFDVDWEKKELGNTVQIELEETDINIGVVRPLGDNLLAAGFRCFYDPESEKGEDNAVVFDRNGKLLYSMCLGDGISELLTYPDGRIIAGYFDEGVFGNYGWGDYNGVEPLGRKGLVAWNPKGEKIWEYSGEMISDVYDLEYGDDGSFWYYAYTEFDFARIDKNYNEKRYSIEARGSNTVLYESNLNAVIFDGGYNDHSSYYIARIDGDAVCDKEELSITCEGNKLSDIRVLNSAKGLVAYDLEGNIYIPAGV